MEIDSKYFNTLMILLGNELKTEVDALEAKWKIVNKKKMHNEYLMMKFENMIYEINNDKLKHQIKMMRDKIVFLKNEVRSKTG